MSTISLHLLPEPAGASPVAQTALHTYLPYPTSSLSSSLLPSSSCHLRIQSIPEGICQAS